MRIPGLVLVASIVMTPQFARGGAPSIERFFPAGGPRGTEFTVKFVGAGLETATEILTYSSGIRCVGLKATAIMNSKPA